MKFLVLLTVAAVASAKYINLESAIDLEDITAYGYLSKIGAPLAERIRKAEEDFQGRIVGGSASNLGQFPYQAGLLAQFSGGQGVCGGSLITANRVLTAAHCWWDGQNQATSFIVVLGSIRLFSGGTRQSTSNVIVHSSWNPSLVRNDIAVIRLNSNVALSNNINVIALPTSLLNENLVGEYATASGFGRTSDSASGDISINQFLSHVTVLLISNTECQAYFPDFFQAANICTSGVDGKGTCSGDSGGPLTVNRDGRPILIGIASFGSGSGCEDGYPSVYTRVFSFIAWITGQM